MLNLIILDDYGQLMITAIMIPQYPVHAGGIIVKCKYITYSI